MPEDTGGEKSLPASARKLQKAREEGNIAKSQDLSAAFSLLMALMAMNFLGPGIFRRMVESMQFFFTEAWYLRPEESNIQALTAMVLLWMAKYQIPFMLVLVAAGLAINLAQVGFVFSSKALQPKFSKLNPITGLGRFVSVRTLVEFVKSLVKLSIVGSIVWYSVRDRLPELLHLTYKTPVEIVGIVGGIVVAVWIRIIIAMFILGVIDFMYQRWQHGHDLRMTVKEARDETKELEGDPRIKQHIRQIQRQIAMQRMMGEVPEADVIITNPTTYAVALRYDVRNMAAPTVVAKGARLIAQRIRDLAVEHDVPIVEKPELARALHKNIEVGQPVPEHLFRAVAEILAYVYQIDRREEKQRERRAMMAEPQAV